MLGVEDASDIQEELREARVVVVPGRACHPRASDPSFRSAAAACRSGWRAPRGRLDGSSSSPQSEPAGPPDALCCALLRCGCRRCPFVRVSFSHLPPEELEEGMRRLGAVLHSLQQQRQ